MQNALEFMAAVVGGVCWLALQGVRNEGVELKGDNVTSLRWCEDDSFRAGRSRNTVIVYTMVGMEFGISKVEHVKGIDFILM